MDLGILNTVIALVIILLVLSLLVQAVQTFVKKLLKLKSRQIGDSLKDLYEQAIGSSTVSENPPAAGSTSENGKLSPSSSPAEQFKDRVLDQFKNIGRKTAFGNPVLDSLSKQDLFKVIGKLELEQFFPDYVAKFQVLCDQVLMLRKTLEDVANNPSLRGAATSKLAEMRAVLAPIFTNVQSILEGTQIKPKLLFADLLRLGKLNVREVLDLLDEAQLAIAQEKEIAANARNNTEVEQLHTMSDELSQIAKLIGDFTQTFDDAVSPLRHKLDQVEIWFDTVTQSFDERYTRHMRTVSICISIVVVIVLNANFFRVYKSISANEVQRNLIVDSGPEILKHSRESRVQPEPTPAVSPSPAAAETGEEPSPTPTPINVREEIERTRQEIDLLSSAYQGFGFTPLGGQQVRSFLWSTGIWTAFWDGKAGDNKVQPAWWGFTLARNEKGVPVNEHNEAVPVHCQEVDKNGTRLLDSRGRPMDCNSVWRLQTRGEWWDSRKTDVVTLIGWAITVMLLSVGAPFWQDALESLFGIKNLLRQRSATQNIETQSGAGQTKQ
ncbi:MAG TPA: hypothetical protein VFS77_11760 [Pyrinomonadaceae bacterium]|nr:hypothetical protein [Pyrinomonadaceae bacterium]